MEEWILLIKEQSQRISLLEGIGVAFGVAQVWLAKNNKIWLYPCGLVSITITAYLFLGAGLYAETLLQIYYFIMSIYGWILWTQRKGTVLSVSYSTSNEWKIAVCIFILSWVVLYLFLKHFTNSDVFIWDSFVSASAWAGMWLLAKRKIENWIFLNISNFAAVPLLIHKGLFLYSLLTVILFIVAILGYFDWKKSIKNQNN